MQAIADGLIAGGLATAPQIAGCSATEIADLERRLGVELPAAYRAFLAQMGKSAGRFMRGSAFLWTSLVETTVALRELAAESEQYLVPLDAIGFWEHQGYQVLFFRASAGDDPPVFHWIEQEPAKQVSESFTAWLKSAVERESEAVRALPRGWPR